MLCNGLHASTLSSGEVTTEMVTDEGGAVLILLICIACKRHPPPTSVLVICAMQADAWFVFHIAFGHVIVGKDHMAVSAKRSSYKSNEMMTFVNLCKQSRWPVGRLARRLRHSIKSYMQMRHVLGGGRALCPVA